MLAESPLPTGWSLVVQPPSLFRRFTFTGYRDTRAFLDRLAQLSEETRLYPDLGFGTTHANVTVYAPDGGLPGAEEHEFARRAGLLADTPIP